MAQIPLPALSFEGKLPDEKVYHVFQKHWVTDLPEMLMTFFLIIVPFGGLLYSSIVFSLTPFIVFLWILGSVYFAFMTLYIYIHWLDDAFDMLLLTDQRLVDIVQESFMHRKTTVAELNQIQHASYSQRGLIDHLLNTGLVDVKTAGQSPDLKLKRIEEPEKVTDLIMDFARRYQGKKRSMHGLPHERPVPKVNAQEMGM